MHACCWCSWMNCEWIGGQTVNLTQKNGETQEVGEAQWVMGMFPTAYMRTNEQNYFKITWTEMAQPRTIFHLHLACCTYIYVLCIRHIHIVDAALMKTIRVASNLFNAAYWEHGGFSVEFFFISLAPIFADSLNELCIAHSWRTFSLLLFEYALVCLRKISRTHSVKIVWIHCGN